MLHLRLGYTRAAHHHLLPPLLLEIGPTIILLLESVLYHADYEMTIRMLPHVASSSSKTYSYSRTQSLSTMVSMKW